MIMKKIGYVIRVNNIDKYLENQDILNGEDSKYTYKSIALFIKGKK